MNYEFWILNYILVPMSFELRMQKRKFGEANYELRIKNFEFLILNYILAPV